MGCVKSKEASTQTNNLAIEEEVRRSLDFVLNPKKAHEDYKDGLRKWDTF